MNHNQKILSIKNFYEKKGFLCKRNFSLFNPKENRFSLIDLTCWKGNQARAFEIESKGQIMKNAEDLKRFKSVFKNSKTCQLTPDMKIKDCFKK